MEMNTTQTDDKIKQIIISFSCNCAIVLAPWSDIQSTNGRNNYWLIKAREPRVENNEINYGESSPPDGRSCFSALERLQSCQHYVDRLQF